MRVFCVLSPLLVVLGSTAAGISTAQTASTSAHAMIVSGLAGHVGGGQFDCATSGPQPSSLLYFGSASVGLPTEGYSYCGLAGGIDDTSNPGGASVAHQALVNGFGNGVHNQVADAVADYGILKVSASGSYTGNAISGFAYHDGEAAAYSTDVLPVPAGARFFQFGLTVDGSASIATTSQILGLISYRIDAGPIYGMFTADIIGKTTSFVRGLDGVSTEDVAGFAVTPNSVSGSGNVLSLMSELPSAATFDLTLAMLAASYPSPFGGVADLDFSETARLSSLGFFDAAGKPIAFGSITGQSGRIYDSAGVHLAAIGPVGAVPEPSSWASMIAGFALAGIGLRRTRRHGPRIAATRRDRAPLPA